MSRIYHIYGDYGLESETELNQFVGLMAQESAISWAKRYCRRDLGGYETVEVISFASDGEAITHWRMCSEDH